MSNADYKAYRKWTLVYLDAQVMGNKDESWKAAEKLRAIIKRTGGRV